MNTDFEWKNRQYRLSSTLLLFSDHLKSIEILTLLKINVFKKKQYLVKKIFSIRFL